MESAEHRHIGNQVHIDAGLGVSRSKDGHPAFRLSAPGVTTVELTYGQLLALGGDLYGTPDLKPISSAGSVEDQVVAFEAAFQTLAGGDRTELGRILDVMDLESATVEGVANPAAAYAAKGDTFNLAYNEVTGGAPASAGIVGMATNPGRYTKLATHNLDHFGQDAVAAYRAGHIAACRMAATDLPQALARNAFADHFLTDLFASGHIRTPRRLLNEYDWHLSSVVDRQTIGSLLSRAMHDEENRTGLTVTAAARPGSTWQAFGDQQTLEPKSAENLACAVSAVQLSIDEVVASRGGTEPAFAALQHVPAVPGIYPPTGGPSIAPMLVHRGNEPLARTATVFGIPTPGLGSRTDYDYTGDFLWESIVAEVFGPTYLRQLPEGIFVWLGG